ncbi:hypothetical protein [Vibrio mediterranei]|uniref:hypothetical protein n=1 Tax=Vibrio mediterranei TaxID=689 RepID=UPI00406759F8
MFIQESLKLGTKVSLGESGTGYVVQLTNALYGPDYVFVLREDSTLVRLEPSETTPIGPGFSDELARMPSPEWLDLELGDEVIFGETEPQQGILFAKSHDVQGNRGCTVMINTGAEIGRLIATPVDSLRYVSDGCKLKAKENAYRELPPASVGDTVKCLLTKRVGTVQAEIHNCHQLLKVNFASPSSDSDEVLCYRNLVELMPNNYE